MKENRRSALFLTELVFDLLIFVLCAAVCAALLVKARGMSRDSRLLTDAVALAETAAETLRGAGAGSGTLEGDDGLSADYVCASSAGIVTARITVRSGEREVYTLTAAWPEARP